MLTVEQIHKWRGQEVHDDTGEKIGKLDEVFYDSVSGEAQFISVTSGLLGRKSHLVTLVDAAVGRDYVRVAHSAAEVHAVEVAAADGQLEPEAARAAAASYGVFIDPDAKFESAALREERRVAAEQAAERAAALEHEAAVREEVAATTQSHADDAAQASVDAAIERDDARRAAADGRRDAEQAARDAGR
jgi:PRC-barrel domain protein